MFKVYKHILGAITGAKKEKKVKHKKFKTMPKTKLTPEQKKARREKIRQQILKNAKYITEYGQGKPIVKVTPKKEPERNFFQKEIDLGFMKVTGKQAVIGGSVILIGGAIAYNSIKK